MTWMRNHFQVMAWLPFILFITGELLPEAVLWLASFPAGAVLALAGTLTLCKRVQSSEPVAGTVIGLVMSLSPFFMLLLSVLLWSGIPTPD